MVLPSSHKLDIQEEGRLTAVLLTEAFNENFQPLLKTDPLALLPLVNIPILDYALDWLQRCEVLETIVYCCAQPHADRIRDHCKDWTARHGKFMDVSVISSENCSSLGDAMRDLYSKSLLKRDFILLTVDVVGNLDLRKLMEIHKATRKAVPSAIMTCIYLQNSTKRNKMDKCQEINLVVDLKSGKIIVHKRPEKTSSVVIPVEALPMNAKVRIFSRLDDPNIFFCSEIVPSLFSDNFDYRTSDSLVQGIVEQEELLGYSIHAKIIEDEFFATRISSFGAYQRVSDAVVRRWNHPAVPEQSLSSRRIRYSFQHFIGSYWDPSAKFHKKSIGSNVVIDAGTEIDPRCKIRSSVIGKHCVIKENVSILDSFILSNVTISQGCILDNCFVAHDVKLLPGVHLEPGVVVGPNTVLGPNLKVNRCTRLMSEPTVDHSTGQSRLKELDPLICGREGNAYLYEEDPDETTSTAPKWGAPSHDFPEEGYQNSSDNEDEDEDVEADDDGSMSDSEKAGREFVREVNDSILNGLKEKCALANVILEINSSRHAYNVPMDDVLLVVTKGILRAGADLAGEGVKGEELWNAVNESLSNFADLLRNYIKKPKDQMTVLKAIEEAVMEDTRMLPVVQKTLYELNQELELLDDDVICFWNSKSGSTPVFPSIQKTIAKFVTWLNENSDDE